MSRLTRDGTAEPVSRDHIFRSERGQEKHIFPVQLTTSRRSCRVTHVMLLRLEHATLALSLSRIAPPIYPRKVFVQYHTTTTASERGSTWGPSVSASRTFTFTNQGPGFRNYRFAGDGHVAIDSAAKRQYRSRLHSIVKRDVDDSRVPRNKYTPTSDDIAMVTLQVVGSDEGWKGQECSGDEEQDRHDQTDRTSVSSESRLKDVVTQLQGDIQAGKVPKKFSHVRVDGLFAELRASNMTWTSSTVAIADTSKRLETPSPSHVDVVGVSEGALSSTGASASSDQDLESLSDMLGRLQASAKARDLAEASKRAVVFGSGINVAGASVSTPLNTYKHEELKTRFADMRKGRVSWAVLPLVVRAREAGIPLSTGVYNAAIAAYMSSPKKYADALRVLQLLKDSGDPDLMPDRTSYNIAMRVCSEAGKWRMVYELLVEMRSEGIAPDTTSYNCALNGLAKRREWYRARRLFRSMVASGVSPNGPSYNGLVEAAGMGSISPRQNMIQIVYDMEQVGVEPTHYTYTLLLDCLVKRGKAFDGFQVMARLVDARAPLLPLGYRAGLSFCKEYGDWRRAMILMEDMRVAKTRISGAMCLLAVQACAKGGQWERALSLMVERQTTPARGVVSRQAERKRAAMVKIDEKTADDLALGARRANELDMKILEAVLGAVSDAGQFEVAIRLLQQMRTAGKIPTKACYLYALRAASKWGRWDVVESLMTEMRVLGVGVVPPRAEGEEGESFVQGTRKASRVLSSDCYPPLIEACAQAAAWEKAIKAYREGFVVGRREVKTVNYRVYECVLKACVATRDGHTALEVIRRQAAEPGLVQAISTSSAIGDRDESSGGPPDRRCWCLAAEALGRAGMIKEGHGVLRAMVNSGMPVRESTRVDVPSLMPLPSAEGGFDWHRRRRRRRRRPARNKRGLPLYLTFRRETVIRQVIDSTRDDLVSEAGHASVESSKKRIAGLKLSKGVINGEACAAAAVAAAGGEREGRKRDLRLGRLLVSDWMDKNSKIKREVRSDVVVALGCKQRRMREFSETLALQKQESTLGEPSHCVDLFRRDASSSVQSTEASPMHLRPGGRRGRNEALTLRIHMRRTPGVLGRENGSKSELRGVEGKPA